MSSRILEALKATNVKHNVGSLNNWGKEVLNQGAKVVLTNPETYLDNFVLGELGFDATTGERTVKSLSDATKKGVIIASVEDYLEEYETISDFFNGANEYARIVYQESGKRFDASNYTLDDPTKVVKNGQVAHYDITTKKFIISNGATNNAGYATAGNKYIVVNCDLNTFDGQAIIRFEIA